MGLPERCQLRVRVRVRVWVWVRLALRTAGLDLVGPQLGHVVELLSVGQQLLLRPPRRPLPAGPATLLHGQRHRHLAVLQLLLEAWAQ